MTRIWLPHPVWVCSGNGLPDHCTTPSATVWIVRLPPAPIGEEENYLKVLSRSVRFRKGEKKARTCGSRNNWGRTEGKSGKRTKKKEIYHYRAGCTLVQRWCVRGPFWKVMIIDYPWPASSAIEQRYVPRTTSYMGDLSLVSRHSINWVMQVGSSRAIEFNCTPFMVARGWAENIPGSREEELGLLLSRD